MLLKDEYILLKDGLLIDSFISYITMQRFEHTTLKWNVITLKFSSYSEWNNYIDEPKNWLSKKKLSKASYMNEVWENVYVVS